MKKVISFDLDGTIVDAAYGNAVWLEGIPKRYACKHGISIDEAKITVKSQYDSVGDAYLLWYDIDYWLGRLGLTISVADLLDEYTDHLRLLPHVAEVVKALSEKYRLVIASNAARIFVEKELSHTGLGHYFDRVISATSDFEMVKKQEEFYRRLCSTLNISPAELVHVGDHAVFDVEVPAQLGIDCYHYCPASEKEGRVIHDFRELLQKL